MNARHLPGLALLALAATSCGNRNEPEDESERMPNAILPSEVVDNRFVRRVDVDRDGAPDVFIHYNVFDEEGTPVTDPLELTRRRFDDMRLAIKWLDTNTDGRTDVVRTYDEGEQLTEEQLDTNFDGTLDFTNIYRNGILAERRTDADGDGFYEEIRYYRGQAISRLERDEDGDGRREFYEYFRENELTHFGIDQNGDTVIDEWTRRQSSNIRRNVASAPEGTAAEGSAEAPVTPPAEAGAAEGSAQAPAETPVPVEPPPAEDATPDSEGSSAPAEPAEAPALEPATVEPAPSPAEGSAQSP
jgi:hypothetical protein